MNAMKCALLCLCIFASFTLSSSVFAAEPMASSPMKEVTSDLSFSAVKQKALAFIKSKNLILFAEYDHAKNAQDVQLALPPTTVLVFGSPQVGTKLMQTFPGIGMELPLKVLISQNAAGKTTIRYPDLAYVFAPYGVKKDHAIVQKMQKLLEVLAMSSSK